MKTIYKYPLVIADRVTLDMPRGGKLLTVGTQKDEPMLWVEVDPAAPTEARIFEVFGTGHAIREDMGVDRVYVGTCFQGPFVWHVYEYLGV